MLSLMENIVLKNERRQEEKLVGIEKKIVMIENQVTGLKTVSCCVFN